MISDDVITERGLVCWDCDHGNDDVAAGHVRSCDLLGAGCRNQPCQQRYIQEALIGGRCPLNKFTPLAADVTAMKAVVQLMG